MEPAVYSGDLVIVQRFSKAFNGVDRGDVVIAKSPAEHKRFILKRVKAVDGQMVKRNMSYQTVSIIHLGIVNKTIIVDYYRISF